MYENILLYFKYFNSLPDSMIKKYWIRIFNEMSVHTRKRLPSDLLLAARPNEEPHILQYRLSTYEPITYEPINTCLDRVYRVIGDNKFTIKANDNLKNYIKEKRFKACFSDSQDSMDLLEFLRTIAQKRVIEDPNGWIVWFPTGAGVTDDSKSVAPMPMLVYSSQYKYSDDNVFIFLADEKSPLTGEKGEILMEGDVYWFITKTEYWKMYQKGKKSDPRWVQEMTYAHNLDEIPMIVMKGDMTADNYYESFFSPFNAFANDAIRQYSDWRAIMVSTSFPIKEEFAMDCEVRMPALNADPDDSEETNKPGDLIPVSGKTPFNTYYRKVIPKGLEGYEAILPAEIPSVRYIHPDINVAKYAGESWEKLIEKAKNALNLEQNIDQAQSGKAKELDKEDEYSLINKICDNFFDNILLKSLRYCDALLKAGKLDMSISIIKPSSYAIKTEDDIVNELGILKEKKVPAIFLASATMDLSHKRFSGNPLSAKIFDFVMTYDPLFIYSNDEIDLMSLSARIPTEMAQRSLMYFPLLNQIAREKSEEVFVDMPLDKIRDEFEKKFKGLFPPPILVDPATGLPM